MTEEQEIFIVNKLNEIHYEVVILQTTIRHFLEGLVISGVSAISCLLIPFDPLNKVIAIMVFLFFMNFTFFRMGKRI